MNPKIASPWTALLTSDEQQALRTTIVQTKGESSTRVKAKNAMNSSFDEPVRKGRKPEVSKHHPAVLECRRLYQTGLPLHRVAIEGGVEYTTLARWFDKGWMEIPRKRKIRGQE